MSTGPAVVPVDAELLLGDSTLVVFPVLRLGPQHIVGLRVEGQQVPPLFSIASRLPFHSSARVIMRPSVRRVILYMTRKERSRAMTRPGPVPRICPTTEDVVAVGHPPRLRRGEAHLGSEHGQVRRSSTRSVVEPIELDMRNAQIACEPRREGGLARTCIAGDQQSGRHAHAGDGTAGLLVAYMGRTPWGATTPPTGWRVPMDFSPISVSGRHRPPFSSRPRLRA